MTIDTENVVKWLSYNQRRRGDSSARRTAWKQPHYASWIFKEYLVLSISCVYTVMLTVNNKATWYAYTRVRA